MLDLVLVVGGQELHRDVRYVPVGVKGIEIPPVDVSVLRSYDNTYPAARGCRRQRCKLFFTGKLDSRSVFCEIVDWNVDPLRLRAVVHGILARLYQAGVNLIVEPLFRFSAEYVADDVAVRFR